MELKPDVDRAQSAYAASLAWGTRIGLSLLVAAFAAYVLGLVPTLLPIDELPRYWSRPASELLAATGTPAGWGWATWLPRADMLVLAAIALVASCSIVCLLLAMRAFGSDGERVPAILCILEVVVILLAASGLLAAH
jgi:hypothetical protein